MRSGGRTPPRSRLLASLGGLLFLLLGLPALAQEPIIGGDEPVVLTADELVFDPSRNRTTAVGNVELSRGERRLLADTLTYDEATGKVFAKGNIVLLEATGDAIYGDEMEITGDLKTGVVRGVRAMLADGTRLAGVAGQRQDGNLTTVYKAVYSPCQLCPDGKGDPVWQIRADSAVHDQQAQTLTYRNAVLEMFGVPVLFTPWFSHPDPTVKKRSGFLVPTFGSDSELGLTAQIPYFINIAPNRDMTLAPLFTTQAGTVLFAEARDLETFGRTTMRGSITHTDRFETESGEPTGEGPRGHFDGAGRYTVTDNINAGWTGLWTSDKTYLARYNISNANILNSNAFIEGFDDRDYWSLNAWAFQGLRSEDDQDTIPFALPWAQTHLVSDRMAWGSAWTLDSSVLGLTRTKGRDVQRASSEVGWEVPYVGGIGDIYRLRLSLRGDAYNVQGTDPDDPSVGSGSETVGRLLPRATLDWSWPLVGASENWQHEVEPLVSINIAPPGGEDNDIPNEDSIDFEFDDTNLFLPIRFTGLDRNEGGSKIAYGVRFSSQGPRLTSVSGLLGASIRYPDDDTFPSNSGLGGYYSNLVGRLDVRPGELFDAGYRFRYDASSAEFQRADLLLGIGPPRARINLRYIKLSAEAAKDANDNLPGREALIAGFRVQMSDAVSMAAQTRRDLKADETVANTFGILYSDDCLVMLAGVEKDFTTRGDVDKPLTFTFRVGLKTLGSFETGSGLFGF
ncbi:MAG: LPS assembly protein LptD [Geminicoccaceae bacterium]